MTTSSRKSYNLNALRGGNDDDLDVCEMNGVDPSLAYTPELPFAIIEKHYQENIDSGLDKSEADARKARATATFKKLLK